MYDFVINRIIALASGITCGHWTIFEAKFIYRLLKGLYKDIEVPYQLSEELSLEYMKELYENIKIGICSEVIIERMALIAEKNYSIKIKAFFLLRLMLIALILIGIVIIFVI